MRTQETAANNLHYTPITWNVVGGGFAPIETKGWTDLTPTERAGATQLGYYENVWDCFVDHYKSWTWDRLRTDNAFAHENAKELGWTRTSWDGSGTPESDNKWWGDLTDAEQSAANALCYFEENWNQIDMNPNPSFFPHPLPEFRYIPWSELSVPARRTARDSLDYTQNSWNLAESNPLETSAAFYDLNLRQQEGANALGFYPHTWDCHVNHFNAYYWMGLHDDLKLAVETLGWIEDSWDHPTSQAPVSEIKDWSELSSKERAAATMLCYFHEVWDDVPITEWYDYETGVNTAVSPDGPMPEDIDMSIFQNS